MTKPTILCLAIAAVLATGIAPSVARDTKTAQSDRCDQHYKGDTCVPVASDVDCAGGSGNGPEYVSGPFRYRGSDIYGLDRDHDGVACE